MVKTLFSKDTIAFHDVTPVAMIYTDHEIHETKLCILIEISAIFSESPKIVRKPMMTQFSDAYVRHQATLS